MALPTIDVPTFEVEMPTSKQKIKFRPFLVKEDKILTLATNGSIEEMISACQQVLINCSFGEYDAFNSPMFELQWVFLQVKANSVGNIQDFRLKCGECEQYTGYQLDLFSVDIKNIESLKNKEIKLDNNTILLARFPASKEFTKQGASDTHLIKCTIDAIYQNEEKYTFENEPDEEVENFINSLPIEALKKLEEFYLDTPYIEHVVEYTCKGCDKENVVSINGYENFFA